MLGNDFQTPGTRAAAVSKRPRKAPSERAAPRPPETLVDRSSRYVEEAHALRSQGRDDDALKMYAEAIRREPNNVHAYAMAALAYAELFEFERFEQTLAALAGLNPRQPAIHYLIGVVLNTLRLPERALASFERAAKLAPATPRTWMDLALLYERIHRLEDASACLSRATQTGYNPLELSLLRARIQRRQELPVEAEATLHAAIRQAPPESELACEAWGELALLYDAQEEYARAVDAIRRAKHFQQARAGKVRAESERFCRQTSEAVFGLTAEQLRRWRDSLAASSARPMALLTGFPRSGTTLLEQMLDAHPLIASLEERNVIGGPALARVHRGRPDATLLAALDDLTADEVSAERRRYFRFAEFVLGASIGDRLLLDKNPGYNLVIPLALRLFPESRLIVALRDPRDVVLSCYLRYLPLARDSVWFLDVAAAARRYAMDMNAWLRLRGLMDSPWCEVRYEDVVDRPETELRRIAATLAIPWDAQVLNYRDRLAAGKQVASPTYEAVSQPINRRPIGRWRNYADLLEPTFDALAPFVEAFGYRR